MKTNGRKKSRGQSLVSVIIAAGVGAIVLGFLTDMLVQQGISQKFITQKLEMNDLTANLITTFSRSDNCTCQFSDNAAINPNSNSADLKFNVAITNGSQSIDFRKLYAGCESGGVMPMLIAEEGLPLPNSSTLRVNKVEFVDLEPTGGEPNEWQGKWRISFQVGSGSAIRSVRPVQVTQKVIVAPNGVNTRITSCKGLSSGSGTQDFLAKWSPTAGVLENSIVFEDETNNRIGIGLTAPDSKLHVKQAIDTVFGGIQITNVAGSPTSGANTSIYLDASNKTHIGGTYTSPDAITIDNASGHVGIGTATPADVPNWTPSAAHNVLDVSGKAQNSIVSSGVLLLKNNRPTATVNDQVGAIAFAHKNNVGNLSAAIESRLTGDGGVNGFGSNILFHTKPDNVLGHTPRMVISQAGNVGIGVNALDPFEALSVKGNIEISPSVTSVSRAFIIRTGGYGYAIAGHASSKGWALRGNDETTPYGGNQPNALSYEYWTGFGGVTAMAMTSNGNIGVGTTNPGSALHVYRSGSSPRLSVHNPDELPVFFELAGTGGVGSGSGEGFEIEYNNAGTTFFRNRFSSGSMTFQTTTATTAKTNLQLLDTGNVNMGFDLYVSGCINSSSGLVSGSCISDIRIKKDIKDFQLGLNQLLGINPVQYKYNGLAGQPNDGTVKLGVIAQDVEKSAPEIVHSKLVQLHKDDHEKSLIKTVDYGSFIYILINSVKELYARWMGDSEELHGEIEKLKHENASQSEEIRELKARLERIEKRPSM